MHYKKKETGDSYVWFGASGVGFGAAMWGSEPLMWGSEVSFANNGVRRSEMWGSWPPSPPTLIPLAWAWEGGGRAEKKRKTKRKEKKRLIY